MKVLEIFETVQGEGLHTGAPTTFVRFAGCKLHCSYCDTEYAWKGVDLTKLPNVGVPFILDKMIDINPNPKYVCITGGEPLQQDPKELFNLFQALQGWVGGRGLKEIVVETNGSMDVTWLLNKPFRPALALSLDFKMPSSGKSDKMLINNYKKLESRDVVKFVCANKEDLNFAEQVLQKISQSSSCNATILFHAVGGLAAKWLAEEVLQWKGHCRRFDIRIGIQLHKLLQVK